MASDDTSSGRTREAVTKRSFKDADGNYTPRVHAGSVGFRIELLESGYVIEKDLKDYPEDMIKAAALWGLVTNITNTIGNLKDSDEMAEAMESRSETIEGGEWTSGRESGPRTSDILEAYVAFRTKHGKDTSQERKDAFTNDIKNKVVTVKDLLKAEPGLAAEYAAIKARRSVERSDKMAAKAKETSVSTLLD